MNIVTEINDWLDIRKQLQNKTIGLVHTMGNLHDGHMSLIARSKQENQVTVAAIFINPTQFNQRDDFDSYPRTLTEDQAKLTEFEVDYLLLFSKEQLYPDAFQVQISETIISQELEGLHRPGHFTGMLTIVLKVLNLVQPVRSYYGEKDYQQLLLIKKMAQALFLPLEIVGCPTVRNTDSLALSSRNNRLTKEQQQHALHLPRLLHSDLDVEEIKKQLTGLNFKIDYVVEQWGRRLAAVWLDEVRLIDNVQLREVDHAVMS